ncbi:pyruvoyl-dependent arginine decarboxylase [Calditrichota bacterium]
MIEQPTIEMLSALQPLHQHNAMPLPDRYKLVSGAGDSEFELNSFDRALQAAQVGRFNLVKVSSIFPAFAANTDPELVPSGSIMYAAIGSRTSSNLGELISAAVAIGVPADPSQAGVIMETSGTEPAVDLEDKVRRMATLALEDRGFEIGRIESISSEHRVEKAGAAFAAVILWKAEPTIL